MRLGSILSSFLSYTPGQDSQDMLVGATALNMPDILEMQLPCLLGPDLGSFTYNMGSEVLCILSMSE